MRVDLRAEDPVKEAVAQDNVGAAIGHHYESGTGRQRAREAMDSGGGVKHFPR